jgi:hypothetical protein
MCLLQPLYECDILSFIVGTDTIKLTGYLFENEVVFEKDNTYGSCTGIWNGTAVELDYFHGMGDLLL